ncbi:Ff.00g081990.m01.CDS01 [Fusarium sp. VM40]|nr:Ff.00g081990.m01.CDS01 [Fusarium sp. VM40]
MASAGANGFKSPKIPRRPKTPESRQVHFDSQVKPSTSSSVNNERITGFTSANSPSGGFCNNISGGPAPKSAPGTTNTAATTAITSAPAPEEKVDTQPTSFPALGLGPLQWHTSANPTQSLSHQVPTSFISPPPQQPQIFPLPQFHPASFINTGPTNNTQSPITYIGIGPQTPTTNHPNIMGDYQNAAPPVQGVHFQPPVPDTTFGPMQHVYVPRFDGGLTGVQQPFVGTMAPQPNAYGSYVVQQQPYYIQQPAMGQQPVLVAGQQHQQFMPQMQHVAGLPSVGLAGGAAVPGTVPVFAGNVPGGHHVPDVSGMGRTAGEEQLRQIQFAHANKLYEPQEFKPADDDPSRFYYVREVDGNWTQRNRFTIDHMGDSRWYVTDEGWFYAVRLPN